jgi:hypothetical protein
VSRPVRLVDFPRSIGIVGKALGLAVGRGRSGRVPMPAVLLGDEPEDAALAMMPDGRPELAVAIPGARDPWGVLLVVGDAPGSLGTRDLEIARVAADGIGAIVSGAQRADEVAHLLHRAEALRRVASDIGSRLDLDRILAGLVDHAMVLFEGDRAAVFHQHEDGNAVAEVSRGCRDLLRASGASRPVAVRRGRGCPSTALRGRLRPRPARRRVRAAIVQEGFAPSARHRSSTARIRTLNIYHDRPHEWTVDELEPSLRWRPRRVAIRPPRTTRGWRRGPPSSSRSSSSARCSAACRAWPRSVRRSRRSCAS